MVVIDVNRAIKLDGIHAMSGLIGVKILHNKYKRTQHIRRGKYDKVFTSVRLAKDYSTVEAKGKVLTMLTSIIFWL